MQGHSVKMSAFDGGFSRSARLSICRPFQVRSRYTPLFPA